MSPALPPSPSLVPHSFQKSIPHPPPLSPHLPRSPLVSARFTPPSPLPALPVISPHSPLIFPFPSLIPPRSPLLSLPNHPSALLLFTPHTPSDPFRLPASLFSPTHSPLISPLPLLWHELGAAWANLLIVTKLPRLAVAMRIPAHPASSWWRETKRHQMRDRTKSRTCFDLGSSSRHRLVCLLLGIRRTHGFRRCRNGNRKQLAPITTVPAIPVLRRERRAAGAAAANGEWDRRMVAFLLSMCTSLHPAPPSAASSCSAPSPSTFPVPGPSSPPSIPPTGPARGGRMSREEMVALLQQQWERELLRSGSRRFGAVGESSKEGEGRWKRRLQNDMSSTGVAKLKPYHVSEVLRTLFDADVGLALFRWAKDVQGVTPDEFVYSALFGLLGRGKDAAGLARAVEEMREDGCCENAFTLQALAAAYARAGRFEEALATLAELEHQGFSDGRRSTVGARVDVLFRMGRVAAEAVFKEMISRGMVSSVNTLMEAYGSVGRIDDAMAVFDRMCLAAVAARTNQGGGEGERQKGEGNTREGGGTGSCAQVPTASPEVSQDSRAVRPPPSIWPAPDMITYRSAVNLLGIAGRLSEAEATFEAMLVAGMHPDAMAWSTLVLMWARESNPECAAMWFNRMLLSGCQPNAAAYNALLLAFVSAEMFDEAEEVLSAFKNGWDVVGQVGITPGGEKHTNFSKHKPENVPCSTGETMGGHGYVRPGRALNLVRGKVLNLPVGERPDLMTYTMLLNACTACTARSGVGRLMRLMEETEHPAHSVFQLLLEGFEGAQSVCRVLMGEAVSEGEAEEGEEGAAVGEVEPTGSSSAAAAAAATGGGGAGGGGALSRNELPPLQWMRPGKVEVVTGWGKRSRVQGASLVKAAVEALLLRDLTAPFSLHRSHPGSYEALGADLEQWLLTPGVDQLLAPKNED
ncbi:unnamed protein product [Closterium sp. Yama58-4]|nr:unnamed protein product [Closterium sp. Yama58-4]